jgi:hypothetical protein
MNDIAYTQANLTSNYQSTRVLRHLSRLTNGNWAGQEPTIGDSGRFPPGRAPGKGFVVGFFVALALGIAITIATNLVIDPFGRYDLVNIPRLNALRTQAGTDPRLSKAAIVSRPARGRCHRYFTGRSRDRSSPFWLGSYGWARVQFRHSGNGIGRSRADV